MANLEKFRQYHYDATVKVSENTRTLAVSAIAIVWLFKKEVAGSYEISKELLPPLAWIFGALTLDFLQYVYRSVIWHYIFKKKENELANGSIKESTELYVSDLVNLAAYVFFYLKIICLGFAYFLLTKYFLDSVTWS